MKILDTLMALLVVVTLVVIGYAVGSQKPVIEPIIEPKPVYETIMIEGNVYSRTFKEFYKLTDTGMDHYHIILDTDGGDAAATVGIMNRMLELQQRGVYFTTEVYTKAFSAGALIWMMGDTRIMHSGSQLMFHTMIGQKYRNQDEIPSELGEDRAEFFYNYDDWVTRITERQFPETLPIIIETMLWQSGMTFINAEQARELNMLTEYVDN